MPATASRTHPNQQEFDFLMPYGPMRTLLKPVEVARVLCCTVQHVYNLINEGKLEAHRTEDREQNRYRITRRSVLTELASSALYDGEDQTKRVLAAMRSLTTRADIAAAQAQLARQLNQSTH